MGFYQQKTCMIDNRKIVDITLPQFSLKTLKNIYLKFDLPD